MKIGNIKVNKLLEMEDGIFIVIPTIVAHWEKGKFEIGVVWWGFGASLIFKKEDEQI